jgi:hypothetical protein
MVVTASFAAYAEWSDKTLDTYTQGLHTWLRVRVVV